MTMFLEIIPVRAVSNDIILNAIFGGLISAIGVGIALKWGDFYRWFRYNRHDFIKD